MSGVFGGKSREALEWAATLETEVTELEIDAAFGMTADAADQWEEIEEFDKQLYVVLRATTEGIPFDLIDNVASGRGLEGWRALHKRYDPSTGSRKRVMLQALTNPGRSSYENLQGALERWKALRSRYDRKKDQLGVREALPDSLAMNALERLVPKELETHLMLNYSRLRTFDEMEREIVTFMEARTGSKMNISSNFSKPAAGSSNNGAAPMDIDALVKTVSGNIASLVGSGAVGKGKGKGSNKITCNNCGKPGHKQRDCWQKPGDGGKGKGQPSSGSASPKKDAKFQGKCHHCGKVGHRKPECWNVPGNGKGKGGKPNTQNKGKGNAASVEQAEPEPPAEAGGLDLCTISVKSSSRSPSRRTRTSRAKTEPASTYRDDMEEIEVEVETEDRSRSRADRRSPSTLWRTAGSSATWTLELRSLSCRSRTLEKENLKDIKLKTASGEVIGTYGDGCIRGTDRHGIVRKVNGKISDVHKILVSASRMHKKGFCTWMGPGGGDIIPLNDPVCQALGAAYDKAIKQYGDNGIIPLYEENGVYNFYLKEHELQPDEESPKTPKASPPPWKRYRDHRRPAEAGREGHHHRPVCAVDEDDGDRGDQGDEPALVIAEGVEARAANPGWTPVSPTDAERREHEASGHAVYRSWCQECMQATGAAKQHRRVPHDEDLVDTIIVMDFFYLGEEEGSKPHLVAQDRRTGMMVATALDKKNAVEGVGQKVLTRFLELLGYKQVVLKSDGERPLVALKAVAARKARCVVRSIMEESPVGDSKANGEAEAAVKEIKWRIRAVTLMLEKKLGVKLEEGHPLLTWIPRYAAEQSNRYKVGSDGRTPEERRTGKRWIKPMPVFGENIMVKPIGKGRRGDMAKMKPARFLGAHNRFGSVLAMTTEGVLIGSSYHSLTEEKWEALPDGLRGAPWDVRTYVRRQVPELDQPVEQQAAQPAIVAPPVVALRPAEGERAEVPGEQAGGGDQGEEMIDKSPMIGAPSASTTRTSSTKRAWAVRREHLNKFGRTTGCAGCDSILRGMGFQQIAHTDSCRMRIKRCLEEQEEKKEAVTKKQKEEDERIEVAMQQRLTETQPLAGGEPVRATAAGGEPAGSSASQPVAEMPEDPPTSPKRKGGEQGAQDIEDLAQETQAELEGTQRSEAVEALGEAAKIVADLGALDVLEVFSPQRLTKALGRFGMRHGVAVDLEEGWDLDLKDYKECLQLIVKEMPLLVTSSPPCTAFSKLRNLSNAKRDPQVVAEEVGRERVRRSIACCKLQANLGGLFLHEHPKDSDSWKMPEVEEMINREDTYLVQSPMCRFGMKLKDPHGELLHVRKETWWLTNSKEIAAELQGACENQLAGKEIHRHVQLIGEQRARAAQVYPPALMEAILRGLKREMRAKRMINSIEEKLTGPSPDDYNEWETEVEKSQQEFLDDSSGAALDAELVKKARAEELQWLKGEKVYTRVPASEAQGPLLKIKWIDINKGDNDSPKVRSRLVAKEIRKAKAPDQQLLPNETFSSTPPTETVFALLSLFMTRKRGEVNKKKIASWGISRAHFMGKAARDIWMELPEEDKVHNDDIVPMVGKLERSMYGTMDASKIFQEDWQSHLKAWRRGQCTLHIALQVQGPWTTWTRSWR